MAKLPTILDTYTGETRILGSLPSDPRLLAALPNYSGEILPESELKEFDAYPKSRLKIKDQNGRGACNGFALAAVTEGVRFVQGQDYVPLSGWYPYAILCNGVDRGSNILQGYALIQEKGIAPEETVDYGIINPKNLTQKAHTAAQRFRLEFGESYQSWRQVVSGVMLREVLNLSICVGNSFNSLDSESVPGVDRGPGNHAVTVGLGLKKSKRWGWLVRMRNSWSEKWGDKGFCWLAEAHIEAGSYFECMSGKAVIDDPESQNPPILAALPKRTTWTPKEFC